MSNTLSELIIELENKATSLESREPKCGTRMEYEGLSTGYAQAETIREIVIELKIIEEKQH